MPSNFGLSNPVVLSISQTSDTVLPGAGPAAPVAAGQSISTSEDAAVNIVLTASDANGDILTYAVVDGPSNGVLSGSAPSLIYTPNANYNGSDSFTFKANDGTADSAVATVSITVTAANDTPAATAQSVAVSHNTATAITLAGSDIDGNALTYTVLANPANGSLTGTAPNLTYTPNSGYAGSDSFTFRVNDGTADSAAATVTLTVAAATDPSFANVSLLLKADGANNSTTFVDSSANNFAISRFGNTRIDSFSPHNKEDGKWSIYFPSQADSIRKNYLLVGGTTSSGNIGTNWTFETWFRGSSSSTRGVIAAKSDMNSDTGNSWVASVTESGTNVGKFYFLVYHGTGYPVNVKFFSSVSRVDDGNWHHLAFVKQGTTYRIFVDGVLESQEVFNTSLNAGTSENITIGGSTPNPNGGDYGRTDCHLSNLRIAGTAVYTSAFSPSTTPLQSTSGTLLLACQGRIFKDNGPNSYSITLGRGSPQISDVSPLADVTTPITGSAYFDGTGDYLAVAANNAFNFGTGDFCVESWVYLIADSTTYQMVASIAWGTGKGLQIRYGDAGFGRKLQVNVQGDTATSVWSTAATTATYRNTWVHLAFTRSSGVCRLFVNGVVQNVNNGVNPGTYPFTSFTDTSNVTGNTGFTAGTGSGTATLFGYLDDLRVTKGVARYTANFTPPGSHPTSGS